jgi:hypothetical protein
MSKKTVEGIRREAQAGAYKDLQNAEKYGLLLASAGVGLTVIVVVALLSLHIV